MAHYKTPLRYPGGKQKIWKFIADIVKENSLIGCSYAEPYAGGAGVALELLFGGLVEKIYLNDFDKAVYAFWNSVLFETDGLCKKIMSASFSIAEWTRQRAIYKEFESSDLLELGFAFFFLNRVNRSGILKGGIIGGKNQNGFWKMDARFSRKELIQRIERIAYHRDSIKLDNLDGVEYITKISEELSRNTLIYCDPPYYNKANRLYTNFYTPDDHVGVAAMLKKVKRQKWIVSYDNTPEIVSLYCKRKHFVYNLQYNAARTYKGSEVFIFCDKLLIPHQTTVESINDALLCIA